MFTLPCVQTHNVLAPAQPMLYSQSLSSLAQQPSAATYCGSSFVQNSSSNPGNYNGNLTEQLAHFSQLQGDKKLDVIFEHCLRISQTNTETANRLRSLETKITNITTIVYGQETRLKDLENNLARVYVDMERLRASVNERPTSVRNLPLPASSSEIVISGLPNDATTDDKDIVTRVLTEIGAGHFVSDILSVNRRVYRPRSDEASNENPAAPQTFSLMVRFKSTPIRNEVMRLKLSKGDLPAAKIFPDMQDVLERKLYLNEWLHHRQYKLLKEVRARAKQYSYERVWIRNESIYVRKNATADRIHISSEADLSKII